MRCEGAGAPWSAARQTHHAVGCERIGLETFHIGESTSDGGATAESSSVEVHCLSLGRQMPSLLRSPAGDGGGELAGCPSGKAAALQLIGGGVDLDSSHSARLEAHRALLRPVVVAAKDIHAHVRIQAETHREYAEDDTGRLAIVRYWCCDVAHGEAFCTAAFGLVRPPSEAEVDPATRGELLADWPALFVDAASLDVLANISYSVQYAEEYCRELPD